MSHISTKIQLLIYSEYTISITIGPHKQIWISEVLQNSYENKMFECLYFNTQYMRNPDVVYTLKIDYVSKINIFGLNMMVKSGLEKIVFVMYVHITLSHKFYPYSILST